MKSQNIKCFLLIVPVNVLLFFTNFANCQTGSISGIVKDSTGNPLQEGIISLVLVKDSSFLKAVFSESTGKFNFSDLPYDSYFLFIHDANHEKFKSPEIIINSENTDITISEIKLAALKTNNLEEIMIVAKIPVIERKMDRTVVNVDAMISSAGNNALELLAKSPGIIVEQSGNIILKGKSGVLILIDDKQTYLSGDALQNYLKTFPASAISQIEIMTNPPAKYDAAGNVGIINIVTKKSKLKGTNGSITLNVGQGIYARSFNSFTLNIRNNKLNFFINGSASINRSYSHLLINRTYKNEDLSIQSKFAQDMHSGGKNHSERLRAGLDYYVSEKTTLGFSINGSLNNNKSWLRNISELRNSNSDLTSTVLADNKEDVIFKNGGLNLNYRKQFDTTDRSLTMDLDYITYVTKSEQSYINSTFLPNGNLTNKELLTGTLPSAINIMAYKADYSHPFKNNLKFETGLKSSYASIDNQVDYFNTIADSVFPDYDKSNHFKYNEFINAVYVNFSREYKRFGFQTGLRGEHTRSIGNQLGNPVKPQARFIRDYFNLFPTVYFSYKLDSAANNQLVLSYGRRIDRPYYEDLNPFLRPLDKFTFYTGNPYLKPSLSNVLNLTYSFKSLFSILLNYSRTTNEVSEAIRIDENNIYFSTPQNIGKSQGLNLGVEATIPVSKWLTSSIYSEISNTSYQSQLFTEQLNSKGNYFYFSLNNSFTFTKGWSAELSGFYITKMIYSQFTLGSRGQMSFALQKKILKNKGSLKLSMNDVFYTMTSSGTINNLRLTDATYKNYSDSRNVFLTFNYNFGKPMEVKTRHEGNGAESEKQRIKQ